MPKIMVSLPQRRLLRGMYAAWSYKYDRIPQL
jgi:hypothetical protein